jgi:hypothetical protein
MRGSIGKSYDTFEQYCLQRWGMTRQHANRLIGSAAVVENLEPVGSTPESERQARELSSLAPEAQRAAWAVTNESPEPVTTARVREVVLFAACANQTHGLQRTNADKRKAVTTLLEDDEWRQWSNPEIARRVGVSDELVRAVRISLPTAGSEKSTRTYTTKHGTEATMNTANEPLTG